MEVSAPSFSRPVFISHAEEDSDIAHTVATGLSRRLTATVHLDKYFLTPGVVWRDKVAAKLASSELLVLLTSRLVAGNLAPGVQDEIRLAAAYNIPVVIGLIRGIQIPDAYRQFHVVNFGEKGDREDAIWEIARFLLLNSSPFAPLGVAGVFTTTDAVAAMIGNTEFIAKNAASVVVIGHTLKAWLSNYSAALREASATVEIYIPSENDVGMPLLQATHRRGNEIVKSIARTREDITSLVAELGVNSRVKCYLLKVKPHFSITAVDIDDPHGYIVVDHYLYKVASENRPHLLLKGPSTPLYILYRGIVGELIKNATRIM